MFKDVAKETEVTFNCDVMCSTSIAVVLKFFNRYNSAVYSDAEATFLASAVHCNVVYAVKIIHSLSFLWFGE